MLKTLLIAILFTMSLTEAFIAYECGGSETNYTAISIADVRACETETDDPIEEDVVIQLLQPRTRTEVNAMSCKIEVNYIVFHCGMHSHASIARGGIVSKVMDLNRDQCLTMHRERTITLYGHNINGLKMNDTISVEMNFAGWIGDDKSCSPSYFVDGNKNWGSVVATGSIKISLQEHPGSIDMESGRIHFRTGSTCSTSETTCMDNDYGPTFWNEYSKDDCRRDAFHVLYRGNARRLTSVKSSNVRRPISVYTVQNEQNVFTLTSDGSKPFCYLDLKKTDHPKLFIQEVKNDQWYFTQKEIPAMDMDMFMYVNTKFLHLEKVVASNMATMYREIVTRRCELERKMLETRLSLAAISPLEFAYEHMGKPGYTATVLGEVVYVIQCTAVEVTSQQTNECTSEMPVTYKNKTMYMRARSRILQSSGTPVPCRGLLHPQYRINGAWFSTIPSLHASSGPTILTPGSNADWTYISAGNLAAAGIYNSKQMEALRDQIMSPIERKAKSERFAGLLNSESISTGGLNMRSLADVDLIQEQISAFWGETWSYATSFGTISAGIIGIAFVLKACKFVVDTVIHALTLHEIYGCTWHIAGAVWDALTTYLLSSTRHRKKVNKNDKDEEAPIALGDMNRTISKAPVMVYGPSCPSVYPDVRSMPLKQDESISLGVTVK